MAGHHKHLVYALNLLKSKLATSHLMVEEDDGSIAFANQLSSQVAEHKKEFRAIEATLTSYDLEDDDWQRIGDVYQKLARLQLVIERMSTNRVTEDEYDQPSTEGTHTTYCDAQDCGQVHSPQELPFVASGHEPVNSMVSSSDVYQQNVATQVPSYNAQQWQPQVQTTPTQPNPLLHTNSIPMASYPPAYMNGFGYITTAAPPTMVYTGGKQPNASSAQPMQPQPNIYGHQALPQPSGLFSSLPSGAPIGSSHTLSQQPSTRVSLPKERLPKLEEDSTPAWMEFYYTFFRSMVECNVMIAEDEKLRRLLEALPRQVKDTYRVYQNMPNWSLQFLVSCLKDRYERGSRVLTYYRSKMRNLKPVQNELDHANLEIVTNQVVVMSQANFDSSAQSQLMLDVYNLLPYNLSQPFYECLPPSEHTLVNLAQYLHRKLQALEEQIANIPLDQLQKKYEAFWGSMAATPINVISDQDNTVVAIVPANQAPQHSAIQEN